MKKSSSVFWIKTVSIEMANLAKRLPNQNVDNARYFISQCEQERENLKKEVMLDSNIEDLCGMEVPTLSDNLLLAWQIHSLFWALTDPFLVGGVDYKAIYAYIASSMRVEAPTELNPVTRALFFQVYNKLKTDIQSQPKAAINTHKY
jgi:hypothetical protein